MERIKSWIADRLDERPWWMNLLMAFSAFMAVVYMPWDMFVKPMAVDEEVWFGFILHGPWAKATEPLHWAIYALGAYGFWRMSPWMWPWAAVYALQVAIGMVVWPIVYLEGGTGLVLGLAATVPFGAIALALWNAGDLFDADNRPSLRDRYGSWALVTGASAGIGAEFARRLAADGVSCVLVARRREKLEELAAELVRHHGVETRVVEADLSTTTGPELVADAVSDLEIAILVNNAGVGYVGRFDGQDTGRLREMVQLNCTAPVVLTSRLLPAMVERRRGAVIVVASVAGRQPLPLHAVYSATKAFDLLFGEALWVELGESGVDVISLQPGPVATEFEAVAGEQRGDAGIEQSAEAVVQSCFESLGRQPSVPTSWVNWVRANANRAVPRSVMALLAGLAMEAQTPEDKR